jgi:hypothetical protein
MVDFNIPNPGVVSGEATDLTKAEMADLSAAKRNTVLYERNIEHLKSQISFLEQLVTKETTEKNAAISRNAALEEEAKCAIALRRAKTEMFVAFFLATVAMTIGGALISSYPITNSIAPWQFYFGWALIIMAIVMGLLSRFLVWLMTYSFPRFFQEAG